MQKRNKEFEHEKMKLPEIKLFFSKFRKNSKYHPENIEEVFSIFSAPGRRKLACQSVFRGFFIFRPRSSKKVPFVPRRCPPPLLVIRRCSHCCCQSEFQGSPHQVLNLWEARMPFQQKSNTHGL
jgi:hypothetical protein